VRRINEKNFIINEKRLMRKKKGVKGWGVIPTLCHLKLMNAHRSGILFMYLYISMDCYI
jgi:hypothetical protein